MSFYVIFVEIDETDYLFVDYEYGLLVVDGKLDWDNRLMKAFMQNSWFV